MTDSTRRFYSENVRRYLMLLGVCLWFGGFTFYSLVVIHVGHRVFDSQTETGFLTERVTFWLNLIGILAILLLFWDLTALWTRHKPWLRKTLFGSLILIVIVECVLFALHPVLERLLDFQAHAIVSHAKFRSIHRWYVNLSTVQWSAMLLYIWCSLIGWRQADMNLCVTNES